MPLGTRPVITEACEECREWPASLRFARSAAVLQPPADRLVYGLKYGGWKALGPIMGRRMARLALPPLPPRIERVVVPVPTTRTRRRRRGYNQAAVLAGAVSEALGRPLVRALRRRSGARTQVALQPSERGRNVWRAFSVQPEEEPRIRDRHVLLVDDVLTTGATAGAASRALESAGVEGVTLLSFARSLPYRGS